jgi:hypothetical protein
MHRLNMYITQPQYQALLTRANQDGCTISELIRRAIEQFLKAEKE